MENANSFKRHWVYRKISNRGTCRTVKGIPKLVICDAAADGINLNENENEIQSLRINIADVIISKCDCVVYRMLCEVDYSGLEYWLRYLTPSRE